MELLIRIILPIYFILFFGIAFVAKSIMVARRIGKNPLVLPRDDSAYGLIGLYFKITLIAIFIYSFTYAFAPSSHSLYGPIQKLNNQIIQLTGLGLLFFSLIWTIIAQSHMRDSWRIGIDEDTSTVLITSGLFSISRNPIFFGMILSLTGLFLATANAVTGIFLILGYILIQIQIRLEEEFLLKQHGKEYQEYKSKTRRLI